MTVDRQGNALVPGSTYLAAGICKADEGADSVLLVFGGGKHAQRMTGASLLPVSACILSDGSVPFLGTIVGITPTIGAHLTTKDYVDLGLYNLSISIAALAASSYQPKNQILTNLSSFLPSTADRLAYFTDTAGGLALATFTSYARTFTACVDAEAARVVVDAEQTIREQRQHLFDDLRYQAFPNGGWSASSTGAGAGIYQATDHVSSSQKASGELGMQTGTTSSGRSCFYDTLAGHLFGSTGAYDVSWRATCGAAATVGEDFVLVWGFQDNAQTNAEPVHGAYFCYRRATSGDYWVCVTRDNSSETATVLDGGGGRALKVPADYTNLHRFRITVNEAGTSVAFYIDGTLVATHTATIPTAAGRRVGWGLKNYKTAGATARYCYVDWVEWLQTSTAARP